MKRRCPLCHALCEPVRWEQPNLLTDALDRFHTYRCDNCDWTDKQYVVTVHDSQHLIRIEPNSWSHRGQCDICGRKSYRWAEWSTVENWFRKHKCEPQPKGHPT